jgi:ABC-type uncharacterized transport system, periplasmic component
MKLSLLSGIGACLCMASVMANEPASLEKNRAESWATVEATAKGQTVYFNAWGGSNATNQYIDWAAAEVKQRYGLTVKQVKVTDTAEIVKRIETEVAAGRKKDEGSVDLLWVNGENFKRLKQEQLLYGPWAEQLPNWKYVDLKKPVQVDFSEPTSGLESPWGTAQLTFIADSALTPQPPHSASELLTFAKNNPGQVTYPKPPDFHGTTFLKQLLLELAPDPSVLQKPVTPEAFNTVTQPLWTYLDQLHPYLWRQGKAFPASAEEMHRMLADKELKLSLTFNPNEAANLIANRQLPPTAYSFGFTKGTIGNVHFLAIPVNAHAKAGAMVFANFLLSPQAQARKADIKIWGDGSVLDVSKLPKALQPQFVPSALGSLTEKVPVLAEPHASWMSALEAEWLKRYGSH